VTLRTEIATVRAMQGLRLLLAIILVAVSAPALAQQKARQVPRLPTGISPEEARYERCLSMAVKTPGDAFEEALAWQAQGGAEAARHCAAVALLYNNQPEAAAVRLEQLAQDMRLQPPGRRAEVLAQAGRAWLDGRNASRAAAAYTVALELAPENPEIWIDRAEAYASVANYWEAIDDLNRAVELDRRRVDAYTFRAAAYRLVNEYGLAMEDATKAVELNPKLADAWLERAILNRLRKDVPAARRDFLQVLILDPDGPAGEAARANIESMELKLGNEPAPTLPQRRR
jgi:tetratricopeptide (TPR) repeat protein